MPVRYESNGRGLLICSWCKEPAEEPHYDCEAEIAQIEQKEADGDRDFMMSEEAYF